MHRVPDLVDSTAMTKDSRSNNGLARRRTAVRTVGVAGLALGLALLSSTHADAAQAPIGLGQADRFAVLAGSGITNTGTTWMAGDLGSFPTPSETGLSTATWTGTNQAGNAVTQQAKIDLTTAYNQAAGADPTTAVATELGGRTLTPGVYGGPTLGITGTLTLDTLGNPNAVFVFKAASTLITASSSAVIVLNGGTACNVFWQVGSSATLGTSSHLIGTVLADTSITATTGATIQGRLLASNGAVTLDHNTITRARCNPLAITTTTASGGGSGGPTSTTPATVSPPTTALSALPVVPGGTTGVTTLPGTPGGTPGTSTPVTTTGSGGPPTSITASPPRFDSPSIPRLPFTGIDARWALAGLLLVLMGSTAMRAANARRLAVT
ncbi:MAG: hypothetical protein QOE63_410 [Acidimicrobiaceae bacterium]